MARVREILPDAASGEVADGGRDTEALLVSPAAPVPADAIARMPALRAAAMFSTLSSTRTDAFPNQRRKSRLLAS